MALNMDSKDLGRYLLFDAKEFQIKNSPKTVRGYSIASIKKLPF